MLVRSSPEITGVAFMEATIILEYVVGVRDEIELSQSRVFA